MKLPRFFIGQNVSAIDKNNNTINGTIVNENSVKGIQTETNIIALSEIKSISFIGNRLDEEASEKINDIADNKMDWQQAVKDNSDTEKLADQFSDFCANNFGGNNKDEVKQMAKEAAEEHIMQAAIDNGTSTADKEIAKYIDLKKEKVNEAEMNAKENKVNLQEDTGEIKSFTDYGEDNVFPVPEETPVEDTPVINADADSTAMAPSNPIEGVQADSVTSDPLEDDVNNDLEAAKIIPMTNDLAVTSGEPIEPTVDPEDNSYDYTADFAEIDDLLKDDDYTPEEPSTEESRIDSVKDTLVDNGVDTAEAEKVVDNIKNDVESAIAHAIDDAVDTVKDAKDEPTVEETPAEETTAVDSVAEAPTEFSVEIPETFNRYTNTNIIPETTAIESENDEVDQEVEDAIDAYTSEGDFTEAGMYESLCVQFDITNGNELLMEAGGCIPDAVLLLAEQIKINRSK